MVSKAAEISKPVVFLDAVDSKYDTLAWCLAFECQDTIAGIKKTWSNTRVILQVSSGGRFTAIEEGKEGIDEIEARIQYEMLHDSVVTKHETTFQVPSKDKKPDVAMIKRILNVNNYRQLYCLHENYPKADKNDEGQVPFSTVTDTANDTLSEGSPQIMFEKFLTEQKSRLAPPPMYPPVFVRDKTNPGETVDTIDYIPSIEQRIEVLERSYLNDQLKLGVTIENKKYKYGNCKCYAYHYERVTKGEQQDYKDKSGRFHPMSDQLYRIGVDGWLWKKVDDQPIYVERMTCFFREKRDEAAARVSSFLTTVFQPNQGIEPGGQGRSQQSPVTPAQPRHSQRAASLPTGRQSSQVRQPGGASTSQQRPVTPAHSRHSQRAASLPTGLKPGQLPSTSGSSSSGLQLPPSMPALIPGAQTTQTAIRLSQDLGEPVDVERAPNSSIDETQIFGPPKPKQSEQTSKPSEGNG